MINLDLVTVHLNDLDGLERTRRSIEGRRFDAPCRWIIIDGGTELENASQEATFHLAKEQCSLLISEPDHGIYDAMNKGTQSCQGEYVLFLNSGDELHPDFSPSQIEDELLGCRPAMIWAPCWEFFPNGALVKTMNRSPKFAWYGIPVNHQNVLFRRDVLGQQPYDTKYQFCADYDLISRILTEGGNVHRTEIPIAIFHRGGVSSLNFLAYMQEEQELRIRHYGITPGLSRAITVMKRFNRKLGSLPAARRLLRKWI